MEKVSFEDHERMMREYDRKERKVWITLLILLCMLFGSNVFWIIHFFG